MVLEIAGARDAAADLLAGVLAAAAAGDAALRVAYLDGSLAGVGIGRRLVAALIDDARRAGIEVLTLDCRGDNATAQHLYQSLGFTEYGRLADFVAVGELRFDKVCYALDLRCSRTLSAIQCPV